MPTPPQQMLEIIPMRRGRPTRHVKSSSGTQIEPEKTAPAATAAASFDPFDPAHVNASSKSEKLDFDPNSIFSLNEKSLADANFQAARSDQEKVEARKSLLAFESDFDPSKFTNNNNSSSQRSSFTPRYESPPMVSAVPSGQNSSSVTGSDHSDDNTAKDKEDDDRPKIRNLVASDIESRIQSLQMHATAATATTTAADADIIGPPKPSRSTPSSQQQQKYKPTPPPKPARFRLSNVVAPVLEPTSSSTTSNIIPNNNKDDRRPSLTDFEEKFPPIDDLYKKLPVDLQSKWFKRNKLFNIRWKMMGLLCLCGQGYHACCKVKLQRAHSNSPRAVTDWWLSLKKKKDERWNRVAEKRRKNDIFLVLVPSPLVSEMCGISAIILADPKGMVCPDLFESLGLLQHRGQVIQVRKLLLVLDYWNNSIASWRTLLVLWRVDPKDDCSNAKAMAWFGMFLTKSNCPDLSVVLVLAMVNKSKGFGQAKVREGTDDMI